MKNELIIPTTRPRLLPRAWPYLIAACMVAVWVGWMDATAGWSGVLDRLSNFSTIVLGIFIEAAPFLLLGSLASGLVEVFMVEENIGRWIPRNPILGAMTGALMGLFFPVCECGVVPLTRRLFQKGLPVPVGIAFLLGAPALNPIVMVSTLVAFGWGPVLWGRIILTFGIASITGVIFSLQKEPKSLLNQKTLDLFCIEDEHARKSIKKMDVKQKIHQALMTAADEFFEIGRYLILGASLAGILQTLIPQSSLLAFSRGPILSVLIMLLLAVLLSVCSTVDAFIALSFAGMFTGGAILAFLVFGPMVDIKSTLMFLHVFRRSTVVYMILIPLLLIVIFAVFLNLNVGL